MKTGPKPRLTKEILINEYINGSSSEKDIAKKYNYSTRTIYWYLSKYNLPRKRKIKDLLNQKFGRLVVIEFSHTKKDAYWKCLCSCGNEKIIRGQKLQQGKTKSCGCYRKENSSAFNYKGGKYITGTTFSSIRNGAKKRNIQFNISISDIEEVYEKQNCKCKFTGQNLIWGYFINKNKIIVGTASVDRIDSNKPYIKDNIQIVHKDINIAKHTKTNDEFINICKMVALYNE